MEIDLLIIRNRARLEKMITEEKDYKKILRQSQKLDRLLNKKMKELV
ncbi:MAG: Spo0E family sporulation regulatory protein-aspartic acid phosphatase [Clostridia bacterium]|nr:Spo0E family sporulation regulatory protein-aspartic acid phosphatase [Clostridia bacterium]